MISLQVFLLCFLFINVVPEIFTVDSLYPGQKNSQGPAEVKDVVSRYCIMQ